MTDGEHAVEAIADLLEKEMEAEMFRLSPWWREYVPQALVTEARAEIARLALDVANSLIGIPTTHVRKPAQERLGDVVWDMRQHVMRAKLARKENT